MPSKQSSQGSNSRGRRAAGRARLRMKRTRNSKWRIERCRTCDGHAAPAPIRRGGGPTSHSAWPRIRRKGTSAPAFPHAPPAPLSVMEVPPPSVPTDAARRASSTSPRWREPCTTRPGAQRGPAFWPLLRSLFWARETGPTPGRKRRSPTVGLHLFFGPACGPVFWAQIWVLHVAHPLACSGKSLLPASSWIHGLFWGTALRTRKQARKMDLEKTTGKRARKEGSKPSRG